jgi:hypothetical protein
MVKDIILIRVLALIAGIVIGIIGFIWFFGFYSKDDIKK